MSVTPENAPVRPAYVRDKVTGLYYKLAVQGLPGSGSEGGVSDHGSLSGLADDDHPQYHNDARGDLRYSLVDHTHSAAAVGAEPAGAVATHDALATAHAALQGTVVPPAVSMTSGAVGTGTKFAREDHRHVAPAMGTPVALGVANDAGSAASLARSDHVHIYPTAANVGAETAGAIATHVALADPHTGYVLAAGDAMTGILDMGNNIIQNVNNPVSAKDAVNLQSMTAASKKSDTATLTYLDGWGSQGGDYGSNLARRYSNNLTMLTGVWKHAGKAVTANTTNNLCTLPVGYRPSSNVIMTAGGGNTTHYILYIEINSTTGTITYSCPVATTLTYISLSGLLWLSYNP